MLELGVMEGSPDHAMRLLVEMSNAQVQHRLSGNHLPNDGGHVFLGAVNLDVQEVLCSGTANAQMHRTIRRAARRAP